MNKIKIAFALFLLIITTFSLSAQSDDFGIWTSIEAEKRIIKGLDFGVEGELRTRNNTRDVDRWSGSATLSYKFLTYLKASASYSYLYRNHEKRGFESGHRYNISLQGAYKWNRFNFSVRERYQHTYWVGVSKTKKRANPKDVLRSKVQVLYDIRKCKFSPYASCEFYNTLNDPQENGLEKIRYTAGTRYKINKKNSLDVYYRYQSQIDEDDQNRHILGFGYTHKF